jgi:UDP-N-acetylglucosamine transferase subunit ALG13
LIFVTVGNANQGFGRLLREVDRLAGEGLFGSEEVFLQTGRRPGFTPQHGQYKDFLSSQEFAEKIRQASLIVCHGGCTVLQVISLGKLPVVMPRMRRYREHINDHQVLFVRALAETGRLIPAYEPADLQKAILSAREKGGRQTLPLEPPKIRDMIRQAIEDLSKTTVS